MNAPRTLLIVGDSISLGVTETIRQDVLSRLVVSYVQLLAALAPDWRIVVNAELHRTTSSTLPLLPGLLAQHQPSAVFFLLGGNDADVSWRRFLATEGKQSRSNVPIEAFHDHVESLAQQTLAGGSMPILADIPDCDLVQRTAWLTRQLGQDVGPMFTVAGGQAEANRRSRAYVAAVDSVAAALGVPVVRWGQRLNEMKSAERLSVDGYHPGAAAHPLIAQEVADVLAATFQPAAVRPAVV